MSLEIQQLIKKADKKELVVLSKSNLYFLDRKVNKNPRVYTVLSLKYLMEVTLEPSGDIQLAFDNLGVGNQVDRVGHRSINCEDFSNEKTQEYFQMLLTYLTKKKVKDTFDKLLLGNPVAPPADLLLKAQEINKLLQAEDLDFY